HVSDIRIGSGRKRVFHVMTNSFPASKLNVEYKINLTQIRPEPKPTGELETARQAIRRVSGDAVLSGARDEVLTALQSGAEQV
ncbi:hypothetical protein Q6272_31895, partial [Klebsiella pneumoniae]